MSKEPRPFHTAAPPQTIGQSMGLVYCMACGYLLDSDGKGRTARADGSCVPNEITLRAAEPATDPDPAAQPEREVRP